ncbi:DNA binding protein [Salmonella enterica subsp. indica serovar 6,14,25:z10:1,(2),7 str. 1121]|uniref:DNA binding protein n=1 Tax=Salmonella enterica subsp. indica serovar 6,14,25:z10:1,(2),7 str. 1121 TaxID=1173950 RepID=V1HE37_SALER|nr:DNA binding protein [Salmonella enterica subsp. indica serovar 6,14,25:z10:1,(2),7 str. 1121]
MGASQGTPVSIVFGTKGGRPRDTIIQDTSAVKEALDTAIGCDRTAQRQAD